MFTTKQGTSRMRAFWFKVAPRSALCQPYGSQLCKLNKFKLDGHIGEFLHGAVSAADGGTYRIIPIIIRLIGMSR